jgi:hypothetical protein
MIVFLAISMLVVTLTKSEEMMKEQNINPSQISFLNEDESLKSYEEAKKSLLRNLAGISCIDDITSCSGHGKCNVQKTNCVCNTGFTTFPATNIQECNYQQKRQLVAFLCELFLGFGAGHFYSERYTFAGLKLAAFLFGIYIICLFPLSAKCINDRCDNDYLVITVSCFYYCCAIGLAFWFIYDLVIFGQNSYKDGNGIELTPWGSQ